MDSDHIFHTVEAASAPAEARRLVVEFLHGQLAQLEQDRNIAAVAYTIAGLMGTDFARSLGAHDDLANIFTIAGELEVDPPNRNELAGELVQCIQALPRT